MLVYARCQLRRPYPHDPHKRGPARRYPQPTNVESLLWPGTPRGTNSHKHSDRLRGQPLRPPSPWGTSGNHSPSTNGTVRYGNMESQDWHAILPKEIGITDIPMEQKTGHWPPTTTNIRSPHHALDLSEIPGSWYHRSAELVATHTEQAEVSKTST